MTAPLTAAHVRPFRLIVTGRADEAFPAFRVALSRLRHEPPPLTDEPRFDGRDRNHPCMTERDDAQ